MKNSNLTLKILAVCLFSTLATSSWAQFFDESALSLLEKQKKHVSKIYEESTIHITIDPDEEDEDEAPLKSETSDKLSKATEAKPIRKHKKDLPKPPSEEELDAASTAIKELIDDSKLYHEPSNLNEKNELTKECVKYCGDGFVYDRQGFKNEGKEHVCIKYPLKCGQSCTIGWDIKYLVNNSDFTCQTAVQQPEKSPFAGPINAPVTLTEYFDFNCGYCKSLTPVMFNLIESNPHVKFLFKPVNFLNSKTLALAALAANKEGKFFEFYKGVMMHNGQVNDAELDNIIQGIGLNVAKVRSLMQSTELNDLLAANMIEAATQNIKGVPALFINGTQLQSHDERFIAQEIDKASKQ